MALPTLKTVRVMIEGRVQGVSYRAWTVRMALSLGLDGWVRNRMDGSVEALFSGPEAAVDDMLSACRSGPPAARVTAVTVFPAPDTPDPGFRQRPTV